LPITLHEQYPGTNQIVIHPETLSSGNGFVSIDGSGNTVSIEQPFACGHVAINVSGSCFVKIEGNCVLNGLNIVLAAPASLKISHSCGFNGMSHIHAHEKGDISIGCDCLFADQINLATSHVHKIIDVATRERLNPPGSIIIGDHVWLAAGVSIWGGSTIGRDSVIGRGSLVSKKSFPPNSLIAGAPARVIRDGITWEG
jgi:acetyltransferase-like isoleucine patch superfamily enzyme